MNEFELFTNAEAMRTIFQEQLPGFGGEIVITACRVLRTRYKNNLSGQKPDSPVFAVCYELQIAGAGTQTAGVQQLYAKAYLNGRSQFEFGRIDASRLCRPQFGEALVHLPNLGLIVWAFPNDPELLRLPMAVSGEQVKAYLPYRRLPVGLNRPEGIVAVGVEVIRYKPELRCTVRYQLRPQAPRVPETLTIYGKTYATGKAKEIYHHIERLWWQSHAKPHHFLVAEPLGYDEQLQMIWQEALLGESLTSALSSRNYDHFLPMAARGLANLHQSDVATTHCITNGDLLAETVERTTELMEALPEFREQLQQLLGCLEENYHRLAPFAPSLIHCDFHIKQLLVHADRLAICDFDDLALGDPLQDIAFFLADLHFRDFDPHLVPQMAATFCQAYQQYTGAELSTDHLNWHMRRQFLAKAYWYHKRKQLSPWLRAYIRRTIALAEGSEGLLAPPQKRASINLPVPESNR